MRLTRTNFSVLPLSSLALLFICGSVLAQKPASPVLKPGLPLYPLDAVVDAQSRVFVVDRNLHGVWKFESGKLGVLFEGSAKYRTPLNAPRCIAFDNAGGLLVGDSATRDIYRMSLDGEIEPITNGKIGVPMDISVSSDGSIYVADAELFRLVKIPAGKSEPELVANVNPNSVCVDSQDRVWVISKNEQQVQIIKDDGTAEIIVGKRVFKYANQIVVDKSGTAFVSDGYSKAIWKIDEGQEPEILIQGAPLDNPVGLTFADDQLVVVDPRARQVFKVNADNKLESWFEIKR